MQTQAHISRLRRLLSDSYVGQHWRGELSLPVSYFVNVILVGIAATFVVVAVGNVFFSDYAPWPAFWALVAIWAALAVLTIWQWVGVWRSADEHPKRGGSSFWAGAAKFMVVIGALQTTVVVSQNAIPQLRESFRIATGDPTVGPFHLRLINAGTEIEYIGGITFGSAEQLGNLLDAAPEVHTVHLSSHGGRVGEAEKIREIIRQRGLDTYVARECLSACTIAFLGGSKRYLHHRGRLGFHATSFPGVSDEDMRAGNRQIAAEAIAFGVTSSFANRAYLTSSDDMWFPTVDELTQSGFVTDIATGQFAISGFGYSTSREKIAAASMDVSLLSALRLNEPDAFEQFVDVFYEGWRRGQPEALVFQQSRGILSSLIAKYAPSASNEALIMLGGVLLDEIDAIRSRDPIACHAFLVPENNLAIDLTQYLDSDLMARDLRASELVISSGMAKHRQTHTIDQLEALYTSLMFEISIQHGSSALIKLALLYDEDGKLPAAETCDTVFILYKEVMNLPSDDAAALLRDMFSNL